MFPDGAGRVAAGRGGRRQIFPGKTTLSITIEDSGVGFSKNELVNNLGTFAKSGSKAFLVACVLTATFPWLAVRSWLLFGLLNSDKVRFVSTPLRNRRRRK